ncbi:MAG: acyl-CoA thioesterase [Bacteroidales bacterium]|nr:acyl-CoA thioesterase [Bacteroidales bacterium]
MNVILTNRTTVKVRFSEVDSLRIVWHGHFIKYFEDGREAFGYQYGFGYLDFYNEGLLTPIVDIRCQYKKHLAYGDEIIIETEFVNTDAAKIVFEYKIFKKDDPSVIATGKSIQVFLSTDKELILTNPDFFIDWKKKHGLLK